MFYFIVCFIVFCLSPRLKIVICEAHHCYRCYITLFRRACGRKTWGFKINKLFRISLDLFGLHLLDVLLFLV